MTSKRGLNSYDIFYDRTRQRWPFNTGDCMYRFDCSIILFIDIFNLCLLDVRSSRDTQDKGDNKNLPDFKNRPGNVVLFCTWIGYMVSFFFILFVTLKCEIGVIGISKKGNGCKWTWKTIKHYTKKQIQVKKHHFYFYSAFHSHSRVFSIDNNSYHEMSETAPRQHSLPQSINATSGY